MTDIIEKMKTEMFRRKYSIRTIKSYCDVVSAFLRKSKIEDIRKIKKSDIKDYLNSLHEKSGNTINVHLNALKFMMEEILHRNCYVHIKYSKVPRRIPEYLTKKEILRLFDAIENPKHKLMIQFMYSAGFRLSELINLKAEDFNFEENTGWIRGGKGNKDRAFIIAQSLKDKLKAVIQNNTGSGGFIFRGRDGKLSQRTIQEILKQAGKKANLTKHVHPHMLRHSFATHLVKNGTDLFTVQSLLGHNDIKTTQIYAHVANPNLINAKSPIDDLNKKEPTIL